MGNKDTAAAKPATAVKEEAKAAEQTSSAGVGTALQEKAAADESKAAAKQEATGSGRLYIVASPIKHDGKDYAAGDEIRLPEATAHRLAGYLKA